MKKSLKKSEIIENLHRVLNLTSAISFDKFSIIQVGNFEIHYLILLHYDNDYRVVDVRLTYGWIEYEFSQVYPSIRFNDCLIEYLHEIACISKKSLADHGQISF